MSQGVQMPHRQTGTSYQVAVDADAVQLCSWGTDSHHRHVVVQSGQGFTQARAFTAPNIAGKYSPVKPAANQLIHQILGNGLVILCLKKPHGVAVFHSGCMSNLEHAGKVGVNNLGQHNG